MLRLYRALFVTNRSLTTVVLLFIACIIVALSTIVLVDPDLVVTDMGRVPESYRRMGLPVNHRTKHYRQSDGWVHAVDLRTRGRGEIRNRVVQLYFWSMGFSTLRHVGTADHLHVQLATR